MEQPKPIDIPNEIKIDEYLQNLKTQQPNLTTTVKLPRNPNLSESQVKEIVAHFAKANELEFYLAMMLIAALLQSGGSARGCDGNMEVTVLDKTVKLSQLRATLKACKAKGAERKLARAMANDIYKICKELEIPGNLSKKIIRENPTTNFDLDNQIWLSDFQAQNPKCPDLHRKLINETFEKRSQQSKPQKNKQTGK